MEILTIKYDGNAKAIQDTKEVEKVLVRTSKGVFEISETPDGEVRLTAASSLGSKLVLRPRASNLVLLEQE